MHTITDRSATAHRDCVMAFAQQATNPRRSVHLVVTGASPLTKARRLAIGRAAYLMANPGTQALWDGQTEAARLRWTQTHMGRYGDVLVEQARVDGEWQVSYTARASSGGGYPVEDFAVASIESVMGAHS